MAPNDNKPTPTAPEIEVIDVEGLKDGIVNLSGDDRYFPIAVVGVGLRMPMCKSMDEFEKLLVEERSAIIDIPDHRWRKSDYYYPDSHTRGHHCIPKLAFCEGFYDFDPGYFEMNPREAFFIDPQHRQTLLAAEQAVQDSGYTRATLPTDTGVYVGVGIMDFPGAFLENRFFYNGQTWAGFSHSCIANRVSNFYGFTGPSCAVDTACAASLTAVHCGCMGIWNKECSMAITGATSNLYSPETTVAFSQLGVLSSTGNSAPFDHTNNGYVRGEGTGFICLKPLDQAIKDNDHIYCAIRATVSAHNGMSNSLTLPSAPAQRDLIERCYGTFGIPLSAVDYVEAHGTGTAVGDPLETKALGWTFGASRPKSDPLPISSGKSTFGHLEVCAGMVQIMRTTLMLEKRMKYKHINWSSPNHRIDFEGLNLRMQLKTEPFTKDKKYMVGVNTFGFGGSLVHMVFEEINSVVKKHESTTYAGWRFGDEKAKGRKIAIPISAKVKNALVNSVRKWANWEAAPEDHDAQETTSWLATRRENYMGRRLVVLADSSPDFKAKLNGWLEGETNPDVIENVVSVPFEKQKICFVFSGHMQQHFDMGRGLYKNEPSFKKTVDECDEIFKSLTGYSALEKFKIFVTDKSGADPEVINKEACKPAILFSQMALSDLFESWGVKADMVMGVGLGELSAAYACGAISKEIAIKSMVVRMGAPPKDDFIKQMRTVVNGPKPKTAEFLSTVTGKSFDGELDAEYWWDNVAAEKNINGAIRAVAAANKNAIFVEISAKPMLAATISDVAEAPVFTTGEEDECDWTTAQRVMAEIHCTGYTVNWKAITRNCARHCQMPGYGFDEVFMKLETNEYHLRRLGIKDKTFKALAGVVDYDQHFHLAHYTRGEDTVFPAAGYAEYMLEYIEDEKAAVKNIKFPVSLEDQMIVPPFDKDGYIQQTTLKMKLGRGTMTVHDMDGKVYSTGEPAASPITAPSALDTKAIKARCSGIIEPDEMYEQFAKLGLVYGNMYRLLSDVYLGDGEALGLCDGSHLKNRFERIESVILDSAFQVAIGCFTRGSALYVPSEIGILRLFMKKVPAGTPFVVHAVLKEWSIESITCDLTIGDNDGNVWATVTDFKAANSTESKTEVDYNQVVYATKYEFLASCLPSTSHAEKWFANGSSLRLDDLTPVMAALARDALANADTESVPEECKPLLNKIQQIAALNNTVTDSEAALQKMLADRPELAAEAELVKAAAASLPQMFQDPAMAGSALSSDFFNTFVNTSQNLSSTYEKIGQSIDDAINDAFRTGHMKHVTRICEIGGPNTAFSSAAIKGVDEKIKNGSVEYVYTNKTSDTFSALSEEFSELSTIKYMQYDPLQEETNPKIADGTYDIVIYNNFPRFPATEVISKLKNLMTEGGWLIMLRPEAPALMYKFASGTEMVPNMPKDEVCRVLLNSGFEDARVLQGSMASVAVARRRGAHKSSPACDRWVILGDQEPLAACLEKQLPGEKHLFGTAGVKSAIESADSEKKTTLIYLVNNADKCITSTISLIEGLSDLAHAENLTVWAVTHGAYAARNSVPSTVSNGLLRSFQNQKQVVLQCIDLQPGTPDAVADDLLTSMAKIGNTARECGVRKPAMKIPKIVRVPIRPNNKQQGNWRANISHSGSEKHVVYQASEQSSLESDEVRVRSKAIATGEIDQTSCVAFSGIVEAAGAGVEKKMIGKSVVGISLTQIGSHVVTKRSDVTFKPVHVNWESAAEAMYSYCSVYSAIYEQTKVKSGDYVMVHPLSGGIGQAAVHMAKSRGAKVIGSVAGKNGVSNMHLGAVVFANPNSDTFEMDIEEYTEGKGVKAVIQTDGITLPPNIQKVLSYGARVCQIGLNKPLVSDASGIRASAVNLKSIISSTPGAVQKMVAAASQLIEKSNFTVNEGSMSCITDLESRISTTTDLQASILSIPDNHHPEKIALTELQLKEDATYLVTGGYGRVGMEVARWLVQKGGRHIAIASRSGATDIYKKNTARYMQKHGATVYNLTANVIKKSEVDAVFEDLKKQGAPAVRGIFNLAGYTENITSTDEEDLRELLNAQGAGAVHLNMVAAERKLDLDHFVLFGSAVSAWGHPGLANLCAISQHLDAVSCSRKFGGLPSLCVLLGQMRGTGSLAEDEDVVCAMEKAGMRSLHIHEYLDILGSLMSKGARLPPTVMISNQDWAATVDSSYENTTRISHLVPIASAGSSSGGGDAGEMLEGTITSFIGELTGTNPEEIDPSMPMTQYGVDSLMSSEVIAWSQKKFGVTLEQTDIFGGLTTHQLMSKIQ